MVLSDSARSPISSCGLQIEPGVERAGGHPLGELLHRAKRLSEVAGADERGQAGEQKRAATNQGGHLPEAAHRGLVMFEGQPDVHPPPRLSRRLTRSEA